MDNEYFETYGYPLFYEDERMYIMPEQIELTSKDDHDLLVMIAMQGNDTVKQQEGIIQRLDKMNGTVRNDHAWVSALKWVVFVILVIVGALSTNAIGVW